VLTRSDSTATFPSNVTVKKTDYASEEGIAAALADIDFLIISLSARAPADIHPRIVAAAAAAHVPYVMPNYFGSGLSERTGPSSAGLIGSTFTSHIEDVKKANLTWIALCCGFWYEFSLGMGEQWFGFSIPERKVTLYDQGTKKINTSTWAICGDAVASLLALPEDEFKQFDNKGLYVSSFLVSQRDMLESLHRVLGTTDADWTIEYQPVQERYDQGLKEMKEGKMVGFAKSLYAGAFFPQGRGDFETGFGLDNDKLKLQKEELDAATKKAVEMVEAGFGYKG
jgi:hypothetical protein